MRRKAERVAPWAAMALTVLVVLWSSGQTKSNVATAVSTSQRFILEDVAELKAGLKDLSDAVAEGMSDRFRGDDFRTHMRHDFAPLEARVRTVEMSRGRAIQ